MNQKMFLLVKLCILNSPFRPWAVLDFSLGIKNIFFKIAGIRIPVDAWRLEPSKQGAAHLPPVSARVYRDPKTVYSPLVFVVVERLVTEVRHEQMSLSSRNTAVYFIGK